MDIVVTYCERWDTPLRTSKHHFVERFAKEGHRILYVETPPSILTILKRPLIFFRLILPRLRAGIQQVKPNIWIMTGIFPFPYHKGCFGLFDKLFFNRLNQLFFLRRLKKQLNALSFSSPRLIVYFPLIAPVLDHIKWSKVLFHMVDEWQALPAIPKSMSKLTLVMLKEADVTVVTSQRLFDRYVANAKNIHLLRHGTDVELFKPVIDKEISEDKRLEYIPRPRIGYYGALQKIDLNLIREVALLKPEWSFVFMGPASGQQGFNNLKNLPENIFFIDPVARNSLPNYLAGIDVFWMPYIINELTHSMCSIKIYEVLSAGLPCVISDLDESRYVAGEFCYFARTACEHQARLKKAILENELTSRKERAQHVYTFDWQNRAEVFIDLLSAD